MKSSDLIKISQRHSNSFHCKIWCENADITRLQNIHCWQRGFIKVHLSAIQLLACLLYNFAFAGHTNSCIYHRIFRQNFHIGSLTSWVYSSVSQPRVRGLKLP